MKDSSTLWRSWSANLIKSAIFLAIIVLCWWEFAAAPWLSFTNLPFPIINESLHPGDSVAMKIERCNSTTLNKSYMTTREMVNVDSDETISLPSTSMSVTPGCTTITNQMLPIPLNAAPGRYYSRGTVEISDAISTKVVTWHSAPYVIVPKQPAVPKAPIAKPTEALPPPPARKCFLF